MPSPAQPSPARARWGVSLNFLTNGLMQSLLPRLPEIKRNFELGDGFYGIVVAAGGMGAIVSGPLPAVLIRRWGALKVSLVCTLLAAALLVVAGFAPHVLVFAGAFFFIGILDACIDSAQNTQGVAVETWSGKTIINSLHGTWSIGAAIAGVIGASCAGLKIPIGVQALAVSVLIAVLAVVCYRMGTIPQQVRDALAAARAKSDHRAPTSWRRLLPLVPLAVIGLAGIIPEDVANNWGAVYLVDEFGLGFSTAGLAMVTMLIAQIIGRFTADALSDRFGPWNVATTGGILVGLGSLLVVLTPVPGLVYVGFALSGFGCASLIPTAFAAAGRLPGLASGTSITLVSFAMRIAIAGSSPLIGGLAELGGLRIALSTSVVAGLAAAILCRRTKPQSTI